MFGGRKHEDPANHRNRFSLYQYRIEQGGLVVEEVTMPMAKEL